MEAWRLSEARLIQERSHGSAANDESLNGDIVPAGKVWIITAASYIPSAAETQLISFYKTTASTAVYCLLNPISIALFPARATFIEQGMEYVLFPGESISVKRAAHTVGSSMNLFYQFVEIDLPLYTYDDPQTVKRQERALSSIRTRLGGGVGGARIVPPTLTGGDRGGRGGPLEK